ncbi:MAG: transaldolase family protein [Moraxella sp.]|uniref:transaldolase family protein n=1 Tax=Moraxella sp. TaxID=479 RepID=UPI0026DC7C47|nr:transaldolase family protein [Moraxella sp.]MDO4450741.1 transaldolase family protein [Moraxella sp.]
MNALSQLSKYTTIVADTGDLTAIARLRPQDATTNPSLVTTALLSGEHDELISQIKSLGLSPDKTIDRLTAELGKQILTHIDGRVSTEVDARHSFDTDKTVKNALEFIELYDKLGVDTSRILIKIAATWQGIKAAEILEKQGIHCNLTLLFTQTQAHGCADAGVKLISPFVGRLTDWQKTHENRQVIDVDDDLGVNSVKQIYHFYKSNGYLTEIMGASFRSTAQILALAGCDLLTISPTLLDELSQMSDEVTRQLLPTNTLLERPTPLDEKSFTQAQNNSPVNELLLKGIDGFIEARANLTKQLFG